MIGQMSWNDRLHGNFEVSHQNDRASSGTKLPTKMIERKHFPTKIIALQPHVTLIVITLHQHKPCTSGLCQFPTNRMQCVFTSNARTVLRRNSFQFLYACRQVVVQKDRQFRTLNLYRARANEHQYPPVRVRWVCWVSCPLLGSVLTDPGPCASSNRHCVGPQGRTPEATTEANNWGVDYRSPSYASKQKLHVITYCLNKSVTNSTQTTRILCLAKAWKQTKK